MQVQLHRMHTQGCPQLVPQLPAQLVGLLQPMLRSHNWEAMHVEAGG